jgi:hypothetical protein
MKYGASRFSALSVVILGAALGLWFGGFSSAVSAQGLRTGNEAPADLGAPPSGMGRLYVFRQVRSYGAHIDGMVTVNGSPVQRTAPGSGFYCDVKPGDYLIGVSGHERYAITVSVAAGQWQYLSVSLRHLAGVAVKTGAMTSDQPLEVRLLQPDYGARRAHEYHLSQANCQP